MSIANSNIFLYHTDTRRSPANIGRNAHRARIARHAPKTFFSSPRRFSPPNHTRETPGKSRRKSRPEPRPDRRPANTSDTPRKHTKTAAPFLQVIADKSPLPQPRPSPAPACSRSPQHLQPGQAGQNKSRKGQGTNAPIIPNKINAFYTFGTKGQPYIYAGREKRTQPTPSNG